MAPRKIARSEGLVLVKGVKLNISILQWKVASEGKGVERVDVVRVELAPFSSSTSILCIQNGTNFAKVFAG
jgi:hypothetical protein